MRAEIESPSFHGFEEEVLAQMLPFLDQAVDEGADMLLEEMDRQLSRQGPPIPGAPPAEVEGKLRRSLTRTKVQRKGKNKAQADVEIRPESEGGDYAGRQEYGGSDEDGRYLPPHPYARPAAAIAGPRFRKRLQELVGE